MTVSLAMITNNAEDTISILENYGKYFDKWFITVADKQSKKVYRDIMEGVIKIHPELKGKAIANGDLSTNLGKLHISYFEWCDHFGKAREFNREQIDTDYFFWIDSDDVIDNPEALPQLFKDAEAQGLDAVYLKYDYIRNDLGEGIGDHWRERLVRTKHFKWAQTRVHETLIAPNANTARNSDVTILHNKSAEAQQQSMARNIKLLLQDFEETKDPRVAMYLGDNLIALQQFDDALKYLFFLVENGGWDEDKYRAWLRISSVYLIKDDFNKAIDACFEAEKLLPEFPDAYFQKAIVYNAMSQPNKVYEWVKVGMMKPVPQTLSVVDPTLYEYRGIFMGALAALELGKIDEAFKLMQIVRAKSPDYELAKKMQPLFEEAYYDKQAIDKVKWLVFYFKENGGNAEKLLSSTPPKLLADPRFNAIRAQVFPPKKWPKNSVVYYCGGAAENWGPDTLSKGMGGSEEAVVYLTREWAKLGKEVTVFNDREDGYCDELTANEDILASDSVVRSEFSKGNRIAVTYQPWTLLNPNDEFDTFIAWRAPENIRGVNARRKFVDLHDVVEPERVYSVAELEPKAKFFVKSQYHRNLYPELPDDRFVIVGNGIQKEHFNA